MSLFRWVKFVTLSFCILACAGTQAQSSQSADVNMARLLNSDAEPEQWMSYGRTYNEQRFSPLKKINSDNVDELGLAWFVESTPLFIDGVLYLTLPWSQLQAMDALHVRPFQIYVEHLR